MEVKCWFIIWNIHGSSQQVLTHITCLNLSWYNAKDREGDDAWEIYFTVDVFFSCLLQTIPLSTCLVNGRLEISWLSSLEAMGSRVWKSLLPSAHKLCRSCNNPAIKQKYTCSSKLGMLGWLKWLLGLWYLPHEQRAAKRRTILLLFADNCPLAPRSRLFGLHLNEVSLICCLKLCAGSSRFMEGWSVIVPTGDPRHREWMCLSGQMSPGLLHAPQPVSSFKWCTYAQPTGAQLLGHQNTY